MSPAAQPLSDLNPQQLQAVTAPAGQVLVLAGPGSGKTRVLTRRVAWLLAEKRVPPYNLLAVTFTNKAAREMGERVRAMLEIPLEGLWLGTFHAMCARILRRESALLPFKSNFVIFDEDDQSTIIKRAIKELNIDDKLHKPAVIHGLISSAKNNLLLPEDMPSRGYRDEVVRRVYKHYQKALIDCNAMDFDDLLLNAVRLLVDHPDVLESYSQRFEHVLVDEFQDTNLAQYELIKLLARKHGNLFVVGDEDQSIYRWRGADYRNVLKFEQDNPGCLKILLEQNYRSTQTVLDVARAVIDRNTQRTPKALFTKRGPGNRVLLYEAVDDHAEAAYVVDFIHQALHGGGKKGSQFAIMYRTNAQSRLLEEAFLRLGMPYRLVGAQRFYGRREVKDMIAFLRLVSNPDDEVSLGRVINVPQRGIGDKTLLALRLSAQAHDISAGGILLDLGQRGLNSPYYTEFSGRGGGLLMDFGAMLKVWVDGRDQLDLVGLFDRIIIDTGYQVYLDDGSEEGRERWENILELRRVAGEYREAGLTAYLENLALVSDQDTIPEKLTAPTLLTLHAAKGLEFDHVFITGLDEGLLPHSRSRGDPDQMEEERRLFYVGITRARNQLTLVRSERRSTYGAYDYSIPSQFLADIPDELVRRENEHGVVRERASRAQTFSAWKLPQGPGSVEEEKPVEARFKAGLRVRHPSWGEGLVVEVRLQAGEELVDVHFASVGFKRLLASMARLEILG